MCEEIDGDRGGDRIAGPHRRVARIAKVENAPDARDIAADCGIHEAREEWHRADVEQTRLGILPRSRGGLEQFHHRADDRSEERRVGNECVRPCRSRWSPYQSKKKHKTTHKANTIETTTNTQK